MDHKYKASSYPSFTFIIIVIFVLVRVLLLSTDPMNKASLKKDNI